MSAPGFTVSAAKVVRKGTLIGVFNLSLPSGLRINGCMLFEKNGKRWVNFPSKEWLKADGTKSYQPLIEFETRATSDRFWSQVLPIAENAFLAIGEALDA